MKKILIQKSESIIKYKVSIVFIDTQVRRFVYIIRQKTQKKKDQRREEREKKYCDYL